MDVAWLFYMIVMGLCVGSFLNVVVYRLPRGQSIVFPGSRCPSCGHAIRWYDNIPIASWLLLAGKCRRCRKPISPRYLFVEALTGVLVGGLYACFYLLDLRDHVGSFAGSWPMFVAYAALLCGLLACSIVDIEMWIVPLEVCWFTSLVGLVCAAASPHPFLTRVSPAWGAMSVAAAVGLAISLTLLKLGVLRPSFVDAEERAADSDDEKSAPSAVSMGKEHGVNPRLEVLRELLFLLPPLVLALGAHLAMTRLDSVDNFWRSITSEGGAFGRHFLSFQAALLGYLVGGLWIWGIRILGTLGFGREAMGMGDVHILAAVGAVSGWVVPSLAFFVAPFFALAWAAYLWLRRRQRELPYGPWLAVASVVVILFFDGIVSLMRPHVAGLLSLYGR
jgi:leader peptidase (prepilin peptidase) / N-methyltransferase